MSETPTYYTNTWSNTAPDGATVDFGDVDDAIRALKKDIRERFAVLLPVGAIIKWASDIIPPGFVELDGSTLDKTEYSALYAFLQDGGAGGIYGEDTDVFTLPDYRGRFVRGWDHGATNDPDAATRSDRGDTTDGDHVGTVEDDDIRSHQHSYINNEADDNISRFVNASILWGDEDGDSDNAGGDESRPKNKYLRYLIKALDCVNEATIDSVKIFNFVRDWNEATPAVGDLGGRGYRDLQFLKADIITRFNFSFPVGMVALWPSDTIPYLWAECNGQSISRSTYADLFNEIEDFFGPGDGTTTFQVPDFRGLFIRSVDTNANGVSADRDPNETGRSDRGDGTGSEYVGTYQDSEFLEHHHSLRLYVQKLGFGDASGLGDDGDVNFRGTFTNYGDSLGPDEYGVIQGVNKETRPINKTLRVIMRVLPI